MHIPVRGLGVFHIGGDKPYRALVGYCPSIPAEWAKYKRQETDGSLPNRSSVQASLPLRS